LINAPQILLDNKVDVDCVNILSGQLPLVKALQSRCAGLRTIITHAIPSLEL
jgi:hypothetical protein